MTEVAKTFLHCLNYCNFEPPSVTCRGLSNEDASTYKINFTRWLVFCHVPAFCNSLRHFETPLVFGRTLLKAVYQYVCQYLLTKYKNEKDRVPPEKRAMLSQLPKFLESLKHEVLNEDSAIWDPSFKPPLGLFLQRKREIMNVPSGSGLASGKKHSEPSVRKHKRDPSDDDLSDEVVQKAIKKINESNYSNRSEVVSAIYCKDTF